MPVAIRIIEEADRCLQCKNPMCQKGCPVSTNIPEVIRLFKDGKLNEAGAMLFENNPLSVVCSTVCNHEGQCEGHCIRGRKDTPVHFSAIENFISDLYLERMQVERKSANGRSVAVIGVGPAGITVAVKLAHEGYGVTVFDSKERIGGVMRYGIPEFRLPSSVLDRYAKRMAGMGIMFRANTTIGGALEIRDLFRDGYECVFVGTGVWRPRTLGMRGESLANVHFSVDYLADPTAFELGETVAIIGAGNSAVDVARMALRRGVGYALGALDGMNDGLGARHHVTRGKHAIDRGHATLVGEEQATLSALEARRREDELVLWALADADDRGVRIVLDEVVVEADDVVILVKDGALEDGTVLREHRDCSAIGDLSTFELGICELVRAGGDLLRTRIHGHVAESMLEYLDAKGRRRRG